MGPTVPPTVADIDTVRYGTVPDTVPYICILYILYSSNIDDNRNVQD